jgi:uncharacterized membrane protein
MGKIIYSDIGFIHLLASILALLSGTAVLIMRKGGIRHKRAGYVYALSMLILIATAFGIYRLFGGFGVFHGAAVVSSVTLLGGMLPVLRRKRNNHWLVRHYSFMYWSVMGLYAAFVAEMLTRIPRTPFFGMVGIATLLVMIAANLGFRAYRQQWTDQFRNTNLKTIHPPEKTHL